MSRETMTYSGRLVRPAYLQHTDVCLEDVAHHLGNLCRFTGSVREFYTVAEHAVLVSYLVPPELAYEALHHDDAEAYVNDLSSPLKRDLAGGTESYHAAEYRAWCATRKHFGLEPRDSMHPVIKAADDLACRIEGSQLVRGWWRHPTPAEMASVPPRLRRVNCYPPALAKGAYLQRHKELSK